jgi:alkylation response protein AidB-like acyl-CoA dehydrogenase
MDFRFGEDPLLFQTTLRDFLAKEHTPEVARAAWEQPGARLGELWKKLAGVGVPGLLIPEAHGGLALSETFGVLIQEELGRAAVGGPLLATAAVAAPLLAQVGGALAERWLPRIAAGEAVVAVGLPELRFVEDAEVALLLLLPQGDALFAVPRAAARVTPQPTTDPARRIATVELDAAKSERVAAGAAARELLAAALDRGALAAAAQAIGACDRMLELSVAYTSQRKQFGKPIGSYQAVKHMLANAKVKLEYARPVVQRAADSVARGVAARGVHVSMAKLVACEAARFAARMALQCHGAIGYTWEQDLHLFMRRAWSLDQSWGRAPFHLARVRNATLGGALPIGPGTTFTGGS